MQDILCNMSFMQCMLMLVFVFCYAASARNTV